MRGRGVSEVVSSALLFMIAVSLGSMIYAFYYTQISIQNQRYSIAMERIMKNIETDFALVHSYYNTSTDTLTLFIYNFGERDVRLDSVYIDGSRFVERVTITPDDLVRIDISVSLTSGDYRVVLVTVEGFSYEGEVKV